MAYYLRLRHLPTSGRHHARDDAADDHYGGETLFACWAATCHGTGRRDSCQFTGRLHHLPHLLDWRWFWCLTNGSPTGLPHIVHACRLLDYLPLYTPLRRCYHHPFLPIYGLRIYPLPDLRPHIAVPYHHKRRPNYIPAFCHILYLRGWIPATLPPASFPRRCTFRRFRQCLVPDTHLRVDERVTLPTHMRTPLGYVNTTS